ncbi:MAG: apolipoprotein N-acyltransferase [Fimbriimonadaceae bacterium]|nr:apolipoprotein N-acyltransferase [Chthonomonadaceae bacterium]MCO5297706.1 apolipoprotein N-acyltransferase [Fimbriimonadaceae bacterium]
MARAAEDLMRASTKAARQRAAAAQRDSRSPVVAFFGSPFGAALVSAILLLAAFPPFDLSLLVFVALVPWLGALADATPRQAARSGYAFGLVFMGGQMFWLQPFVSRWTHSWVLGTVPWLLATAAGALYFMGAGWLVQRCWSWRRPWLIPIVWAGVELLRSYILVLAFPWGLVATPLWLLTPMIQLAHYGTIYAVSAWVVLANVLGARFLRGDRFLETRNGAMALVALLALSLVRYNAPAPGEVKTVTLGQPGVDLAFGDPARTDREVAMAVNEIILSAATQNVDLVVLPEGLVNEGAFPPHPSFDVIPGTVFGGKRGGDPAYQAAFAFDGKWHYADKTRLVVFGEYVPGRQFLPFLDAFHVPGGDLQPGERVTAIDVGGLRVGPMLCFEGLFYDVGLKQAANGAQLLAQMSIDDWYMGTAAPDQLRMAAPFRAVEAGVPMVRAASLGYSLAVDARGDLIAVAPLGKQVATTLRVTVPKRPDLFPLLAVFPWIAGLSVPAVALASWWGGRRRPGGAIPVAPRGSGRSE